MGIEKILGVESESQSISQFFAVFKDLDKENSFRQEVLPRQRRLVFRLCAFVTIAMPIFMLSDYMVVKPAPWSTFLLAQRLIHITVCIIFLLIITRVRRHTSYDTLVFSTLLIIFMILELGSFTFQDDYALYALFDIIIMICLYASGILTVKLSLIVCVYHAFIAIIIVLSVKELSVHGQIMMVLGYSLGNGAGILLAIAQHRNARQQFLLQHSLQEKTLQLKQFAYRDSLTNALNRRSFQDHFRDIEKMALRLRISDKNMFLIAADIDYFKSINDNLGHDVGDKVLVAFVRLVESNIRPMDKIYRFGGEEFMILMQECVVDIAVQRIKQIMQLLNDGNLGVQELDHPVTCSFGITPILAMDTIDSVCIRADEALYAAKNSGRNQYVLDHGPEKSPQ
jgi:diguanylate cyclase (GGDEF)-like protein